MTDSRQPAGMSELSDDIVFVAACVAQDYRRIQKTFGTDFYYAYAKQEDFKRFFKEMELGKKA